jgi:hypothetical protein
MIVGTISTMKIPNGPPPRAQRSMRRRRLLHPSQSALLNFFSNM